MDAYKLNVLYRCDMNNFIFILLTRVQNILLFAYFSDSQNSHHTHSLHINLNNNLRKFM